MDFKTISPRISWDQS